MSTISEHVKGFANFLYYRANNLWYKTTETGLEFPVPIEDTVGATFDAQHKAINLMRWIRKHLATVAKQENE